MTAVPISFFSVYDADSGWNEWRLCVGVGDAGATGTQRREKPRGGGKEGKEKRGGRERKEGKALRKKEAQ